MRRSASRITSLLVAAQVLACGSPPPGPTAATTPVPSPSSAPAAPAGSSTPTFPPSQEPSRAVVDFSIELFPAGEPASARPIIPDGRIVFLVVVHERPDGRNDPLRLWAEGTGGEVDWDPGNVRPGDVAEVSLQPDPVAVEGRASVTVRVERGGIVRTERRTVPVAAGEDDRAEDAAGLRDRFTEWLAVERPELEIDGTTMWNGTIVEVGPLGIAGYLFFSDDWEMGLTWSVSSPPHDWARAYLRHRWDETSPSLAFQIDSTDADDEPREVAPPSAILR